MRMRKDNTRCMGGFERGRGGDLPLTQGEGFKYSFVLSIMSVV